MAEGRAPWCTPDLAVGVVTWAGTCLPLLRTGRDPEAGQHAASGGSHHLGPLVQAAPCHPSTREVPIPVTAPGWVQVSPQLRGVSVCRGPGLGPGECVPVCACVCVRVHV